MQFNEGEQRMLYLEKTFERQETKKKNRMGLKIRQSGVVVRKIKGANINHLKEEEKGAISNGDALHQGQKGLG